MATGIEGEPKAYHPYFPLTRAEIGILEILKDRGLGVLSVTLGKEFCGNSFFTDFEAYPSGKDLSLKINNTGEFRALDTVISGPSFPIAEDLIDRTDFDSQTKKRLLLTLLTRRAETYDNWAEKHWQEKKLSQFHAISAQVARKKAEELISEDRTLQSLSHEDIMEMLNNIVYKATYKELEGSSKAKLLIGLAVLSVIGLYLYNKSKPKQVLS